MNWRINRPDKTYQEESAAENEIWRIAKVEAINNHALRFSCAVKSALLYELKSRKLSTTTHFNGFQFQEDIKAVLPTLNGFCEGKISLSEAEVILVPFVSDSLRDMPQISAFFLTRQALRSIEKIKI